MKNCCIMILCGLLLGIATASKIDYTGHKVIRTRIETKEQLEFLQSFDSIDYWSSPDKINGFADIHVTPESNDRIAKMLNSLNMNYQIYISDVGNLQRQVEQSIALRKALYKGKVIDLENYHTYEEVMAYLVELENTNPLVTNKVGGITEEGRNIVQTIISSDLQANKPVNFFDCNMHAREWITAATCIWIIEQITSGYGIDPEITLLVDQFDWKFITIANPDGYAYTWSNDRLWRKNRVVNEGSDCRGVDINRNFPVGYGSPIDEAYDPCSIFYYGKAAFSERESSTIRDLISADRGRIKTAISVHSYDQQWLSPYGYVLELPSDYPEMLRAMEIAVEALTATFGTQYTYGSFSNALYIGSGVTTDYYYVDQGITHSYTVELRDLGEYAFVLPPDQIVPTAIETWNGIKALVNAI